MKRDIVALSIALAVALANGLAYLFIQPVWQHYDEPGHFEYIWLINNLPEPPMPDGRYLEPRTVIFESMIRNGFFGESGPPPPHTDGMPNIGISQLDDYSTYYLVAAAAVRLVADWPIESQVQIARGTSLVWLLITVTAGWMCACSLTPAGHLLRWLTPLFIATLPPFVDLMTAVNNDSMAIGTYSLAIAFAARILQSNQGTPQKIANIAAMCASASVAAMTKSSAGVAVPIAIWVVGAAFVSDRAAMQRYAIASVVVFCGAIVVLTQFTDAHAWHRSKYAISGRHTRCIELCGNQTVPAAIRIAAEKHAPNGYYLFQNLPPQQTAALRGRHVRLAAQVWTDSETEIMHVPLSIEQNYRRTTPEPIKLSQTPRTVEGNFYVSGSTHFVRILLHGDPKATIYLTNISLRPMRSNVPADAHPTSPLVETEFIRNQTGIERAVTFNATGSDLIDRLGSNIIQWRLALSALQDPAGTGWYLLLSMRYIFETIWTRFGWGNIALSELITLLCYLLCGLSVIGLFSIRYDALFERRFLALCTLALSVTLTFGLNALRGLHVGFEEQLWAAPARYGLTSIVPLAVLLCAGWAKAANPLTTAQTIGLFAVVMGTLNWLSLNMLMTHYH
jgi:hypothetical protein